MNQEKTIDRPIFIVGCGRSGTTILYEMLCGHPDLAWFSSHSQRWPGFPLALATSKLHQLQFLQRRCSKLLPQPVEGYPFWDYCRPVVDSPSDPPLTEADLRPGDAARAKASVAMHLKYQGKTRFINKNTRNTRRIRYLDAIFNDALFIHIVRNPRATVNSLLRVDFWPDLKIWCEALLTPQQWVASGLDSAVLAARLWVAEVQRALDDSASLPANRYVQVRYEDLTEHPEEILAGILAFCRLPSSRKFSEHVSRFRLANMNFKYESQLSSERIALIDAVVQPLARRLGYQLDNLPSCQQQVPAIFSLDIASGHSTALPQASPIGKTA